MTTTTGLTYNRLRARTLRWLLKLATANELPMPKSITFHTITCGGDTLHCLALDLDNDTDVTGWATAINAGHLDEFEVTGNTHQWTAVSAETAWRVDGPRLDWNHIRVTSNHAYRPLTDTPAVTP